MIEGSMVVHVHGMPASGKTALACLLHRPAHSLRHHPGLAETKQPDNPLHIDVLVAACHKRGYANIDEETTYNADIVFILDGGQMSYRDEGLWFGFVKTQGTARGSHTEVPQVAPPILPKGLPFRP